MVGGEGRGSATVVRRGGRGFIRAVACISIPITTLIHK